MGEDKVINVINVTSFTEFCVTGLCILVWKLRGCVCMRVRVDFVRLGLETQRQDTQFQKAVGVKGLGVKVKQGGKYTKIHALY